MTNNEQNLLTLIRMAFERSGCDQVSDVAWWGMFDLALVHSVVALAFKGLE